MHPVLRTALDPLANQIALLSQEEAQTPPLPGQGRWCPQEIIEHLILTYRFTSALLSKQIKSGKVPRSRRTALEFFIRIQTLGMGYMPDGVPAVRSLRPTEYTPESGPEMARRFLAAAEEMDESLVACRKRFGIQACGVHPFYGVMRVDEWRRYHSIHAQHHQGQLENAIRYALSQKLVEVAG
jgi:Protein of unknown function (DUF1569)